MFESVQRYQAEQIRTEKKTKSDRSKGKRDFRKQLSIFLERLVDQWRKKLQRA